MYNARYSGSPMSPISKTSSKLQDHSMTSLLTPSKHNHSILSSTQITPIRTTPRPRYSLSKPPEDVTPTRKFSPSATQYHSNSILYSPSRVNTAPQAAEISTRESTPTHQARYNRPGLFPIVHFFQKKVPLITPKQNRCVIKLSSNGPSLFGDSVDNAYDIPTTTTTGVATSQQAAETSTRSVLDALKEISRKRIRIDQYRCDMKAQRQESPTVITSASGSTLANNMANNEYSKRTREEESTSPKSATSLSPQQPSKRICVVDAIYASNTSSFCLKNNKRKLYECWLPSEQKPAKKLMSVETQTSDVPSTPTIQVKKLPVDENQIVVSAAPSVLEKQKPVEVTTTTKETATTTTTETTNENEAIAAAQEEKIKESNAQHRLWDEKIYAIHKKNKLAIVLSRMTGQDPHLIPVPRMWDKTEDGATDVATSTSTAHITTSTITAVTTTTTPSIAQTTSSNATNVREAPLVPLVNGNNVAGEKMNFGFGLKSPTMAATDTTTSIMAPISSASSTPQSYPSFAAYSNAPAPPATSGVASATSIGHKLSPLSPSTTTIVSVAPQPQTQSTTVAEVAGLQGLFGTVSTAAPSIVAATTAMSMTGSVAPSPMVLSPGVGGAAGGFKFNLSGATTTTGTGTTGAGTSAPSTTTFAFLNATSANVNATLPSSFSSPVSSKPGGPGGFTLRAPTTVTLAASGLPTLPALPAFGAPVTPASLTTTAATTSSSAISGFGSASANPSATNAPSFAFAPPAFNTSVNTVVKPAMSTTAITTGNAGNGGNTANTGGFSFKSSVLSPTASTTLSTSGPASLFAPSSGKSTPTFGSTASGNTIGSLFGGGASAKSATNAAPTLFGNTAATCVASAAPPPAFGSTFGAAPVTTTAAVSSLAPPVLAFGTSGGFGNSATPAFGTSGAFGNNAQTTPATTASSVPKFGAANGTSGGFSFGGGATPSVAAPPAFNAPSAFGASNNANMFGAAHANPPPAFGSTTGVGGGGGNGAGFGAATGAPPPYGAATASAPATTTTSMFGFGGTANSSGNGAFGAPAAPSTGGFSFNAPATTTAPSAFGSSGGSSGMFSFGQSAPAPSTTTTSGTFGFNSASATANTGFGNTFGSATQAAAFGGVPPNANPFAKQPQPAQQPQQSGGFGAAPSAPAPPAFGTGFGQPAPAAGTFGNAANSGFAFGSPAPPTNSAFGAPSAFGNNSFAAPSTATNANFSFKAPAQPETKPVFAFGAAEPPKPAFNFSAPAGAGSTPTPNFGSGGGFGTPAQPQGMFSIGSGATATANSKRVQLRAKRRT